MNRLELAERLVDRGRKLGADEAEAYILESNSTEIQIMDGRAKSVNFMSRRGYGLRVLTEGRMGFASSNDLDLSSADGIIKKLIENTRQHTQDEHNVFPDPLPHMAFDSSLEQFDETLRSISVAQKIEKTIAIERAARAADPRIVKIGWLQYGDAADEYAIVSSQGIREEARRTEIYGYVVAVAMGLSTEGQPDPSSAQTGTDIKVSTRFDRFDPEIPGRRAANFALRMLGASDGKTTEIDAVFPPETGFSFIDFIAASVSADTVQKKKSIFTSKLGEIVASDQVTIIDDGRLKDGLATTGVDAEGIPTRRKEIISGGRLVGLLYDSYTAHRGDTKPTGNADRISYSVRPAIAPTNFYLRPGNAGRDQLIASVDKGLFVTEISGLHAAVDPVSGNFSIPCKGISIEHGELKRPISNITISGNMFQFFRNVDGIADDLAWEIHGNAIGVPTYRVQDIKISGK